jgi:hypothetical protein
LTRFDNLNAAFRGSTAMRQILDLGAAINASPGVQRTLDFVSRLPRPYLPMAPSPPAVPSSATPPEPKAPQRQRHARVPTGEILAACERTRSAPGGERLDFHSLVTAVMKSTGAKQAHVREVIKGRTGRSAGRPAAAK